MKRIAMLVAALAVAILISGCTLNPFATKTETVSAPQQQIMTEAPETTEPTQEQDEVFASSFRSDFKDRFGFSPGDKFISSTTSTARNLCNALESGQKDPQDVKDLLWDTVEGRPLKVQQQVAWSLGYALEFYCSGKMDW